MVVFAIMIMHTIESFLESLNVQLRDLIWTKLFAVMKSEHNSVVKWQILVYIIICLLSYF